MKYYPLEKDVNKPRPYGLLQYMYVATVKKSQ